MAGQEIMRQQFCADLGVFYQGRAVSELNGEWFHVLLSGEPAYPERYERAEYFQNRRAWVKEKGGRWKMIDRHGKEVQMQNTSSVI